MKVIKKYSKFIFIIICFLISIQNCTIYKSANVSLDNASKSNSKVKITKTTGEKEKYSRVEISNNGEFYGEKKRLFRTSDKILLEKESIQKVQISNKVVTTAVNLMGGLVATMAIAVGFGYLMYLGI